jgi:hypothetical protein
MLKLFWLSVLAVLFGSVAGAQTISPLTTSYKVKPGKNVSGSFVVTNNALTPSNVVVETASFRWVNDKQILEAVGTNVRVKLSETSFRLGAKTSHTVNYQVSCDKLPCAVALFSAFISGHVENGVNIAIHLPTSVYMCEDDAKHCREKVRSSLGAKD